MNQEKILTDKELELLLKRWYASKNNTTVGNVKVKIISRGKEPHEDNHFEVIVDGDKVRQAHWREDFSYELYQSFLELR